MKKLFVLLLLIITGQLTVCAQFSRYIIRLKDKQSNPYTVSDPSPFLTQRSIERRTRYNLAIDSTDLPVTPRYIDSIRLAGNVTILNTSKWFNQVCIKTNDAAALNKINAFPFVISTAPIAARPARTIEQPDKTADPVTGRHFTRRPPVPLGVNDYFNYGQAYAQIHMHNGEFLHNHGFRGEGMIMAITDDGFVNYKTLPTFDSVRNNNQVLATWDFVANDTVVSKYDHHGTKCFSTIAANMPGVFVGTAPKTSFYLYITEDLPSEYPVEEQNWVAAAERSDSLGVDVISVSLGYNTFDNNLFNYTYNDLNGNISLMSKAVDVAAKKGLLVVTAMGNSGGNGNSWHYLLVPADADSSLTVGAIGTDRNTASFSSYGPSSDGQVKPDVAAVGLGVVTAQFTTGQPATDDNGTSFACPLMAGISTCLWQAFPEVNNMSIIDALRKSSDQANNPDDRKGYGIPDVKKAFVSLEKKLYSQQINLAECKATLNWTAKAATDMNFVVERKLPADAGYLPISTKTFNGPFASAHFNYTDDLANITTPANIHYRIKMNIAADTSFYLDSAVINYATACTTAVEEKISINPNPVIDQLSVLVVRNNAATVSIVVHSTGGQKVYKLSNQQTTAEQTYTIPMQQLGRGIYYVTVFINGKKEVTKKILKQ